MNNTLEGIHSRITEAEEWINDLGGQNGGNHCHRTECRKKNEKEDSIRDAWDNIKHTNICIIGVPEGKGEEQEPEKIFEEIITEKFLNMGKKIVNQVQEAQRVSGRINPRRNIQRHSNKTDKKTEKGKMTNNIHGNSH